MGEAVMPLSSPRAGFQIVDACDVAAPFGLSSHLVEFAVLDHHRVDDAGERFVLGKEGCATGESVSLEETCWWGFLLARVSN
jgi:hypothetical protein